MSFMKDEVARMPWFVLGPDRQLRAVTASPEDAAISLGSFGGGRIFHAGTRTCVYAWNPGPDPDPSDSFDRATEIMRAAFYANLRDLAGGGPLKDHGSTPELLNFFWEKEA